MENKSIEDFPDVFGIDEYLEKMKTAAIVGGIVLFTVLAVVLIKR